MELTPMNQDNRGEECTCRRCCLGMKCMLVPEAPTPTETDIVNELACVLTNNEQGSFQRNLETAKEYLEAYSKILLTHQHTEHAKEMKELVYEVQMCLLDGLGAADYYAVKEKIRTIALSKNI